MCLEPVVSGPGPWDCHLVCWGDLSDTCVRCLTVRKLESQEQGGCASDVFGGLLSASCSLSHVFCVPTFLFIRTLVRLDQCSLC